MVVALIIPAMLAAAPALRWQSTELPVARTEVQVAQLGTRLYVIGGYSATSDCEARVDVFDAAKNAWSSAPPLPHGGNHFAVAAGDGKVYVFGGGCGTADSYDTAYSLDVHAKSWTVLKPPPLRCGAGSATFFAGKVHVVSGSCKVGPGIYQDVTTHWVYDPSSNTYATAAPLPEGRNHYCLITASGHIYAIGGRHEVKTNERANVDIYDPAADRWTAGAPMPAKRSGAACVAYKGKIFVIGGDAGTETTPAPAHDDIFVYDLAANKWSRDGVLPYGLHGTDAAILLGRLYLPGGSVIGGHKRPAHTMLVSTPLSGF